MYDASFPRMLNCVVPRGVVNRLNERFGSVFSSIAPDWNFCFRALSLEDSIVFFDKAILLHYALDRSNGQSITRGVMTRDYADFLANLKTALNASAPIPGIATVWNAIIHEYCEVKRATGSPKFPELNRLRYEQALALGITWIEDPVTKLRMEAILRAHASLGPCGGEPSIGTGAESDVRQADRGRSPIASGSARSLRMLLGKYIGVHPPDKDWFEFETTEQAIDYAIRFPRLPKWNWRAAPPPDELSGSIRLKDVASVRRPERLTWKFQRLLDRHISWRLHT